MKHSVLRDYEAVKNAASKSKSISEALRLLGIRSAGGNHNSFRQACVRFGIEPPKFNGREPHFVPRASRKDKSLIFCENSAYGSRGGLKIILLEEGIENRCAICGLGPEWNGKPLTLQLDHVNGVHDDNRRENLRLLCPNCHTQTETYAGRKNKISKNTVKLKYCAACNHGNSTMAKRCSECKQWLVPPIGKEKIKWPSIDELASRIQATSLVKVSQELGVTDTAVRSHMKKLKQ